MTGVAIASVIVSAIAALGGILSARESRKASTTNSVTSGRVEMEKEAYERARKLDTETIDRQDKELEELETKNDKLHERVELLQQQNQRLNEEVARISKDNYDLHRENQRVLEMSEQVLADNKRFREQGEMLLEDNHRLRYEIESLRERFTKIQRGMDPGSPVHIRQREADTNPMLERQDPSG